MSYLEAQAIAYERWPHFSEGAMIMHYPFKGLLMLLCSLLLNMPTEWTENHTPPSPTYFADPPQGRHSQHQGIEEEDDEPGGFWRVPWRGPVPPAHLLKAAAQQRI